MNHRVHVIFEEYGRSNGMADAAESKSADRKVVKVRLRSPMEPLLKNAGNRKKSSFLLGFWQFDLSSTLSTTASQ